MGIYSDTDGYDKKQNGHRSEKSGCLSAAHSSNSTDSSSAPLPLLNMSAPTFAISSLVFLLLATFASLQFYLPKAASSCLCPKMVGCGGHIIGDAARPYNASTIGRPKPLADGRVQYQIAVVSDLDHDSKFEGKKDTWRSFLRRGRLLFHPELQTVQVDWDHQQQQQQQQEKGKGGDSGSTTDSLYSQLSMGGRAMELSDLTVFDGRLLTVDDRTGVIYRIDKFKDMIPWVLLNDGPGNTTKGFKAEWTTVKDGHLFVGGLGKEWTTADGVFVNYHPMWIKVVNPSGEIVHVDWTENYKRLRRTVGIEFPGYMIHESGQWSDVHQKWFFLPRRASNETYQEDEDEHRGTNLLLVASEDFSNIEVRHLGPKGDGSRGFSAFHFLPGSDDQILVALKSEEREGRAVASYLCMFRLADGQVLLEEQKFDGPYKYEGLILF